MNRRLSECDEAMVDDRLTIAGAPQQGNANGEGTPMIDVKEAVKRAVEYISELSALSGKPVSHLELEEVEKSPDEHCWLVTLSSPMVASVAQALRQTPPGKNYKTFRVDADRGRLFP